MKARLLDSAALYLPFFISTVGHIFGLFLGERCREGDDEFLRADVALVPLSGGLVIDVEVHHVDAELAGVDISGVLDPFALLTLNVVEKMRSAGLGKLIKEKGKPYLLVEFDAILAESVNLVPLLLRICQEVTVVVVRLGKGEILDIPLLRPVVDDELQLDDSHLHIQKGQPARDFASGHLIGVYELLLSGLKQRVARPRQVVIENEVEDGGETKKSNIVVVDKASVPCFIGVNRLDCNVCRCREG